MKKIVTSIAISEPQLVDNGTVQSRDKKKVN